METVIEENERAIGQCVASPFSDQYLRLMIVQKETFGHAPGTAIFSHGIMCAEYKEDVWEEDRKISRKKSRAM